LEEDPFDDFELEVDDFEADDPDLPEEEFLTCGVNLAGDELLEGALYDLSLLLFVETELLRSEGIEDLVAACGREGLAVIFPFLTALLFSVLVLDIVPCLCTDPLLLLFILPKLPLLPFGRLLLLLPLFPLLLLFWPKLPLLPLGRLLVLLPLLVPASPGRRLRLLSLA
jgi:hypothetical protein